MSDMKKACLIGLLFFSLQSRSQSTSVSVSPGTFNTGGGSATLSPYFMVDWSIGESSLIDTYFGENATANSHVGVRWNVTSGVLQPFDSVHIAFNELAPLWTKEEIRIYPVPVSDVAFIDFRSATTGRISIQLLSARGFPLGTKEFSQIDGKGIQSWNLTNKTSGTYFFRILLTSENGKLLKQGTFKIEKIK